MNRGQKFLYFLLILGTCCAFSFGEDPATDSMNSGVSLTGEQSSGSDPSVIQNLNTMHKMLMEALEDSAHPSRARHSEEFSGWTDVSVPDFSELRVDDSDGLIEMGKGGGSKSSYKGKIAGPSEPRGNWNETVLDLTTDPASIFADGFDEEVEDDTFRAVGDSTKEDRRVGSGKVLSGFTPYVPDPHSIFDDDELMREGPSSGTDSSIIRSGDAMIRKSGNCPFGLLGE